jgi:hypothetical protein
MIVRTGDVQNVDETRHEIAKRRVRAQDNWIQEAEKGHVFKFYGDLPGV